MVIGRQLVESDAWGEVAALLRARGPAFCLVGLGALLWAVLTNGEDLAGPLVAGGGFGVLVAFHGIVAGDLRSGTADLWLQKPVSIGDVYLGKLVIRSSVATVFVATLMGAVYALTWLEGGGDHSLVLRAAPAAPILLVPMACLTFGFSGLGVYPDSVATVVLVAVIAPWLVFGLDRLDASFLVRGVLFPLAFPFPHIERLVRAAWGEAGIDPLGSALHVSGFSFLWLALGLAGLYMRVRSLAPGDVSR